LIRAALMAVCACAVMPRHAHAAPCVPAVAVAGDPAMAAEVAETLDARGLAAPRAGCPVEQATLERAAGGILVTIVDVDGRRAERTVADTATAAALIESFAASELMPARTPPSVRPVAVAAAVVDARVDGELPRVLVVRTESRVHGSIGVAAESAVGSDGSVWFGTRAHACVQLGPACAGGAVRIARDAGLGGDAETLESRRTGYDVLLTVDLPLSPGRWALAPGVGVGTGWVHIRRDFMSTQEGPDTAEINAGGLRADLHVTASVPLAAGVFLTLGAALGLAPNAHSAPYIDEGRTVAGEPRAFGRVDLGLELGRR
jgi:hypothetical protein